MQMTRDDMQDDLSNKGVCAERVNSLVLHQTVTEVEGPDQARGRGADPHSQGGQEGTF